MNDRIIIHIINITISVEKSIVSWDLVREI